METALIVVVVWSFFVYEDMTLRLRCAALFWCYLPLFILVFVMTDKLKGGVTALLHLRFMQWLGGISFELYLTHCIVLRFLESSMFISVFGDQAPATLPFILVTLFFTVVVAWFTKRFFVKPIVGLLT
jgi:peptidoglycan/LPS O-acetylase OafA/YrhL